MIRIRELFDSPMPYLATSAPQFRLTGPKFRFTTPKGQPITVALNDIEMQFSPAFIENLHNRIMEYLHYPPEDISETKYFLLEQPVDFGGELVFYVQDEGGGSGKFTLTDEGEQFTIFSTIFDILHNELQDIGYFVFTGDRHHQRFYDNLETLLPKKLPRFEFVGNFVDEVLSGHKGYIYVNPDVYAKEVDNSY